MDEKKELIPKWPKRLALILGIIALAILVVSMVVAFTDAIYQTNRAGQESSEHSQSYGYIFRLTFANWGQFFATYGGALTLLATAVIACFNWFLVDSTEKLWLETRDAGDTAKASASAAEKSAMVAEDTLVSTNRPWLIPTVKVEGPYFPVAGNELQIIAIVSLENVGKSPAIDVAFHAILTSERMLIPSIGIGKLVTERLAIAPSCDQSLATTETVFVGQQITRRLDPRCELPPYFDTKGSALWLLIGVTYKFTFGADVIHHSGSLYSMHELVRPEGTIPHHMSDQLILMSLIRTYAD